jgi:hypothetical protein
MKKKYNWFMELKNVASRLRWNEKKQIVEAPRDGGMNTLL